MLKNIQSIIDDLESGLTESANAPPEPRIDLRQRWHQGYLSESPRSENSPSAINHIREETFRTAHGEVATQARIASGSGHAEATGAVHGSCEESDGSAAGSGEENTSGEGLPGVDEVFAARLAK